jgi:hypothetical protein
LKTIDCEESKKDAKGCLPPITVEIDISNIIDGKCSTKNYPSSLPSIIGDEWVFNIPSVIVLESLNIPSVITVSEQETDE